MYNFRTLTYTKLIIISLILYIFILPVHAENHTRDDAGIPLIRVALELDLTSAKIIFPSGGQIFDPVKNRRISSFEKQKDVDLRYMQNKFSVSGLDDLYTELEFHPADGNYIRYDGKDYRGYLRAVSTKSGIWIINYVNMEEYLYGVVPFEVPMSWNLEAIKAQAVAARTYAVRCLGQYPHGIFDVYDTVKDQVYGGVDGEKTNGVLAVEGSRGIILTYQGWPVKAYYHADAGGHTEDGKFVFPGDLPYLKGVPSKDDLQGHKWHFIMKKSELEGLVEKARGGIGELRELRISKVSPTGRPRELEVIGTRRTKVFTSNDFRKMIGAGRVRSTLFTIIGSDGVPSVESAGENTRSVSLSLYERKVNCISSAGNKARDSEKITVLSKDGYADVPLESIRALTTSKSGVYIPKTDVKPGKDEYLFVGSGFGHGVGMSQWGAKAYADDGWDYRQILLHYYRGAEVSVWY